MCYTTTTWCYGVRWQHNVYQFIPFYQMTNYHHIVLFAYTRYYPRAITMEQSLVLILRMNENRRALMLVIATFILIVI